jgi:hypothetical protein
MRYFASGFLALAAALLSSCASSSTTTSTQPSNSTRKTVHTQEELRKTGQSETGPALEKVDPSVTTAPGPR